MLEIVFQNLDYLVVNKPVGISVHNNEGSENLIEKLQSQIKIKYISPIHRLDKETSGLQIFALSANAASTGAIQFQSRHVQKNYIGLLRGELEGEGIWQTPLTDKAEGRKNPKGQAAQRVECETRFRKCRGNRFFTLCEFELVTGRQHQIRKHAALAGHALVGDSRYGESRYNNKIADIYQTQRMFLHCNHLHFLSFDFKSEAPAEFFRLLD